MTGELVSVGGKNFVAGVYVLYGDERPGCAVGLMTDGAVVMLTASVGEVGGIIGSWLVQQQYCSVGVVQFVEWRL